MTDIVERLRLLVPSDSSGAAFDAVNEITRLRNELHIAQVWSERLIAGREQDMTEITALRAENEKLRAALEKVRDMPGELNMGNYTDDDVWDLNNAFIETYHIARAALEGPQDRMAKPLEKTNE